MDTGDLLEKLQAEDPTEPNPDWDDDFADIYADPGDLIDLEEVDFS